MSSIALKRPNPPFWQHSLPDQPFGDLSRRRAGKSVFVKPDSDSPSSGKRKKNRRAEMREERRASVRLGKLNDIYTFTSQYIEHGPGEKGIQARDTIWTNMIALSYTIDHLEKVVELMPKWPAANRTFSTQNSNAFVREWKKIFNPKIGVALLTTQSNLKERCHELHCPDLALRVFEDQPKYNLPLTLPIARQLLRSYHSHYPLSDTMTCSALWAAYDLPPLSSDRAYTAILAAQRNHDSKEGNVIGLEPSKPSSEVVGRKGRPFGQGNARAG
jgi:hypothetical protein